MVFAVDQTSATSPTAAPDAAQPPDAGVDATTAPSPPGFGARGRVRRRARFLRKARELAYRDLGGLVFNLHRFGQRNDSLVLAKLATLGRIDAELRALEASLSERQPVTVLREAGITACPRCAAIHSGEDRFCPNCGLPLSRRSDLPIAGAPPAAAAPVTASAAPATPAQPAPAPAQPAVPTAPPATPPTTQPAAATQPPSAADSGVTAPFAPPAAAQAPAPHAPAAPPARAPASTPATQAHATSSADGPAAGRSPAPPAKQPAPSGDDDQPTEIIRPRPRGS